MSILFTLVTQMMKKLPHKKPSNNIEAPDSTQCTIETTPGATIQPAIPDEAADTSASASPDKHQK